MSDRSEYFERVIEMGGGMITCGGGLGVMVSPLINIERCPAGWVFVPTEEATVARIAESVDIATGGRADWPRKDGECRNP